MARSDIVRASWLLLLDVVTFRTTTKRSLGLYMYEYWIFETMDHSKPNSESSPKRARSLPSPLEDFGVPRTAAYESAVLAIRGLSIYLGDNGWERPGLESKSCVTAGRGLPWSRDRRPPGFEVLQQFPEDKVGYARAASSLEFPLAFESPTLPPYLVASVRRGVELGGSAPAFRLQRLSDLREISQSLSSLNDQMLAACPDSLAWVGRGTRNPALLCCLIEALHLPCTGLPAKMFRRGFSVLGVVEDTGLWRLKSPKESAAAQPTMTVQALRSSAEAYTLDLKRQLEASFAKAVANGDAESLRMKTAAWDASLREVQAGTARGPMSFDEFRAEFSLTGPKAARPMPCFAVEQGFPVVEKIRQIVNATSSGSNLTFMSPEIVGMMPWNYSSAVAHLIWSHHVDRGERCPQLGGFRDDEITAYKQKPCADPEVNIAFVVQPQTGLVRAFPTPGLGFGFSGAVTGYCESSTTVSIISCDLVCTNVVPFIDDFTGVESVLTRGPAEKHASGVQRFPGSAQAAFHGIAELLSCQLSLPKSSPFARVSLSCGVETDLTRTHVAGEVVVRIRQSSRDKAIMSINQALDSGLLSPYEAGRLHGRLAYVFSLGKIGRGALHPIIKREHSKDGQSGLDPEIDDALKLLRRLLLHSIPDKVLFSASRREKTVTIFSDARWEPRAPLVYGFGAVAFVVFLPTDKVVYAWAEVPHDVFVLLAKLRERKTYICPLEEIALVAAYFNPALAAVFQDRDVNHFADNTAANGAAWRGYSPSVDLAMLSNTFHLQLLELHTRVWIEWVPSAANLSDDPTRDEFAVLQEAFGAEEIPFVFPPLNGWH
jgi:hypothetical protein